MFCEKCGTRLPDDAVFCPECGNKSREVHGAAPVGGQPEKEAIKESQKEEEAATEYCPSDPDAVSPPPVRMDGGVSEKAPINGLNIAIMVLAVLLLVSVAVGGVVVAREILGPSRDTDEEQTESETEIETETQEPETEEETEVVVTPVETDPIVVETEPETEERVHTYQVVHASLTWDEAVDYCEAQGGYLATVTSQEEFDQIIEMLEQADLKVCWLGGVDYSGTGNFSWITGEPFSYSYWAPGEPNNDDGKEFYLVVYKVDGRWVWNDAPIDANTYYSKAAVGFICEWEE